MLSKSILKYSFKNSLITRLCYILLCTCLAFAITACSVTPQNNSAPIKKNNNIKQQTSQKTETGSSNQQGSSTQSHKKTPKTTITTNSTQKITNNATSENNIKKNKIKQKEEKVSTNKKTISNSNKKKEKTAKIEKEKSSSEEKTTRHKNIMLAKKTSKNKVERKEKYYEKKTRHSHTKKTKRLARYAALKKESGRYTTYKTEYHKIKHHQKHENTKNKSIVPSIEEKTKKPIKSNNISQQKPVNKTTNQQVIKKQIQKTKNVYSNNGREYIIGPGDILSILVWKEPQLSAKVPVRPDGKITLPLINDIQAAGRTPPQLREAIQKALSKFLDNPVVSVSVLGVNSKKFFILGKVKSPGEYPLTAPTTVLQAIAMVGGFAPWADTEDIIILRDIDGHQKRLKFNYNDVAEGKHLEENIFLKPGDTIIVP